MRVLVYGGSVFLSRAVAQAALARGHEVACVSRGASGAVPTGATHVVLDRTAGGVPDLPWAPDAVVDVARHPSWVRAGVAAFPGAHWTFVSTVNVYADEATPGQTPATGALVEPEPDDVPLDETPDAYGRMKVACERLVTDGARAAFVVRPGLIVGPDDPTGRFGYWPERLAAAAADGSPVLAPGSPDDVVQVIDVRDLATWVVDSFEHDRVGTFDAVGEPRPLGALLEELAAAVAPGVDLRWVASDVLTEHGVEPWAGDDAVPLWLTRPAYDGMLAHDPAPSSAAGLRLRPVGDTARDTLAWLRATPDAVRGGLSRERELTLLAELGAPG